MSEEFMDKSRLEKMIELGIYDNKMIDKVRTFGNKSNDNSKTTTTQSTRIETQTRETYRGQGFKPIENSSFKWTEAVVRKRRRTPSPVRRDRMRDQIQTKITRNEMERKLNVDYFKTKNPNNDSDDRIETNSGNNCNDTDLRKSDTDSRLKDTDSRQNQSINRRNDDNLPFIASAAVDEDLRSSRIDERDEQNVAIREKMMQKRVSFNNPRNNSNPNNFFELNRRSKPTEKTETIENIDEFIRNCNKKAEEPKHNFDDIDDFIKKCEMKLGSNAGRGGTDRRPNQNQLKDNESFTRSNTNQNEFDRRSDGSTHTNRDELFNRGTQEDRNNSINTENSSASEPERNPTQHILRETVEEFAKSNLYCQYCDCCLSSLIEVNKHIATVIHQQNMAKKIMADNNVKIESNDSQNEMTDDSEPVVEKPAIGMNLLIKLIEDRKQITLKTLTEMESYEINSDCEASLAKELAKLLTNQLLNYKMNLMPDNVKQALQHQGIGLINNGSNS